MDVLRAARLFDLHGTISFRVMGDGIDRNRMNTLYVSITSLTKNDAQELVELFDCGYAIHEICANNDAYYFCAYSKNAEVVLRDIKPYTRLFKNQINLSIKFNKIMDMNMKDGKGVTAYTLEKSNEIIRKIAEYNSIAKTRRTVYLNKRKIKMGLSK